MNEKYSSIITTLEIQIFQLKEAENRIIEVKPNINKNLKDYENFLENLSASFMPVFSKFRNSISSLSAAFLNEFNEEFDIFLKQNNLELNENNIAEANEFKNLKNDVEDLKLLAGSMGFIKNSLDARINKVLKTFQSEDKTKINKIREALEEISKTQAEPLIITEYSKTIFEKEEKAFSRIITTKAIINECKRKLRITA